MSLFQGISSILLFFSSIFCLIFTCFMVSPQVIQQSLRMFLPVVNKLAAPALSAIWQGCIISPSGYTVFMNGETLQRLLSLEMNWRHMELLIAISIWFLLHICRISNLVVVSINFSRSLHTSVESPYVPFSKTLQNGQRLDDVVLSFQCSTRVYFILLGVLEIWWTFGKASMVSGQRVSEKRP